jgi:predicted acetyltransferase
MATVQLVRFEADHGPVLDRLMALYVYDLADLLSLRIRADARFTDPEAEAFLANPEVDCWRIHVDGALAGFAIASPSPEGWFLEDFFVLRAHRRAGVGAKAARAVFAKRLGPWSLTVRDGNAPALAFWRTVLPHAIEAPPHLGDDGQLRIRFRWTSRR